MEEKSYVDVCDEELYNKLFKTHAKDLYNFLYYKYGVDNNPADLVQEAFLKLWNNCEKVVPEKARSYVFTVANNQMLNELSKKASVLSLSIAVVSNITVALKRWPMLLAKQAFSSRSW